MIFDFFLPKPSPLKSLPPHLAVAFGELGQMEIPGPLANKRILEYFGTLDSHISSDEIAWCAAAVSWVLKQVDIQGTGTAQAQSYLGWGTIITEPRLGCVVIAHRGIEKWMGHVGFFLDKTKMGVFVLGGNQSDRFGVTLIPHGDIMGYRWHNKF